MEIQEQVLTFIDQLLKEYRIDPTVGDGAEHWASLTDEDKIKIFAMVMQRVDLTFASFEPEE